MVLYTLILLFIFPLLCVFVSSLETEKDKERDLPVDGSLPTLTALSLHVPGCDKFRQDVIGEPLLFCRPELFSESVNKHGNESFFSLFMRLMNVSEEACVWPGEADRRVN